MRQLTFVRQRTHTEETEATEALQWLEGQAVPMGSVLDGKGSFLLVLAVARQYKRPGLCLREIVEAC